MKKVQPAGAQLRVECGSLGAELEVTFYIIWPGARSVLNGRLRNTSHNKNYLHSIHRSWLMYLIIYFSLPSRVFWG